MLVLAKEDFFMLHNFFMEQKLNVAHFKFLPLNVVDIRHDARILKFVAENPDSYKHKHTTRTYHLQIDAREYLQNLHTVLIPHGEVITVDYCFDPTNYSDDLQTGFKVINDLKEEYIASDIFEDPGLQDISVNVDMTNLAETKGYQKLFYGKQEQLRVDSFPEEILSTKSKQLFQEKSVNSNFVALVQRKLGHDEKPALVEIDSARFQGKCLTVTRQEIQEQLETLFATLADYPHQALYQAALNLCENKPQYKSYLTEIKQQNYAPALRKAAAIGSKELVSVLLKYKDWLSKDFNINEKSTTGSKTAYDWIDEAKEAKKVSPLVKDQIKLMLFKAGATVPQQDLEKLLKQSVGLQR